MDYYGNVILGVSLKILIIQAEANSAKTYTRMINKILQNTSTWTVVLFVEQLFFTAEWKKIDNSTIMI